MDVVRSCGPWMLGRIVKNCPPLMDGQCRTILNECVACNTFVWSITGPDSWVCTYSLFFTTQSTSLDTSPPPPSLPSYLHIFFLAVSIPVYLPPPLSLIKYIFYIYILFAPLPCPLSRAPCAGCCGCRLPRLRLSLGPKEQEL